MINTKKPKLTPLQSEYAKELSRIKRAVKRFESKGAVFLVSEIPPMPQRVTRKKLELIKLITPKILAERAVFPSQKAQSAPEISVNQKPVLTQNFSKPAYIELSHPLREKKTALSPEELHRIRSEAAKRAAATRKAKAEIDPEYAARQKAQWQQAFAKNPRYKPPVNQAPPSLSTPAPLSSPTPASSPSQTPSTSLPSFPDYSPLDEYDENEDEPPQDWEVIRYEFVQILKKLDEPMFSVIWDAYISASAIDGEDFYYRLQNEIDTMGITITELNRVSSVEEIYDASRELCELIFGESFSVDTGLISELAEAKFIQLNSRGFHPLNYRDRW